MTKLKKYVVANDEIKKQNNFTRRILYQFLYSLWY